MPELPEVETVRRGMMQSIFGKRIKAVQVNRHDLRISVPEDFGQQLTGRVISRLDRRGKYIVMHIGVDKVVILHLGMSGRIRIFEATDSYISNTHDHIVFYMEDGTCFAFEDPRRFGMVYILEALTWHLNKPFSGMGMEPLEADWSGRDLYKALEKRKSSIKAALLDQSVVAGLGNIYVCEALYYAGINPERLSCDITPQEAESLVINVRRILEKAMKAGGSTLKDYQRTDGSLGYFQYQFAVYNQKGVVCRTDGCTSEIMRIVQSGRSTFYCPTCQK